MQWELNFLGRVEAKDNVFEISNETADIRNFFLQLLSRDYGPCKGGYLREYFLGPSVSFRISQSCFKALIGDGNFKFDKFILARNWGSNLDPPFL